MRRRFRDAARVLVSHVDKISIIKVERKVKAGSGGSALLFGLAPALHYELEQVSKAEILRKLKKRFGGKTIRDIRFRLG
jgi:hypothetical protein